MSGNFVKLQAENEILERLRAIEGHSRARDLVFQKVAEQLGSRTLDNAAFSFLLMEMLHRFEWALGEDAGRLAQFLIKSAELLERKTERTLERLVAIAEPAMIIGFGGIVALVALALLQAIYGVNAASF